MSRNSLGTLVLITLCAIIVLAIVIRPTARQTSAQTVPSRTPTPSADDPSPTPPPDDGNGDPDPTSPPTSTSIPTATPTNTPLPIPPTPEDGFLPTAEPCDSDPRLQASASGVNARSGPGLDYEVIAQLEFLEVRPIVGRAQFAEWWQINLADGALAWVANSVANVSGYIGEVPTVAAPPLGDGSTPTPGAPWEPTPRPTCTPSPSATPSRTPTGTATSTGAPTVESAAGGGIGDEEMATGTPSPTASATNSPTPTSVSQDEAEATAGAIDADETLVVEPLPGEGTAQSTIPWLPIAGVGLIVAAVALFVYRRNAA